MYTSIIILNVIIYFKTDPCKYFGCELGAQTQMDPKIGRYIVNGAHDGPKLQELLDGFIKNFVLCEGCENPETVLVKLHIPKKHFSYSLSLSHLNSMFKHPKVVLFKHVKLVATAVRLVHVTN